MARRHGEGGSSQGKFSQNFRVFCQHLWGQEVSDGCIWALSITLTPGNLRTCHLGRIWNTCLVGRTLDGGQKRQELDWGAKFSSGSLALGQQYTSLGSQPLLCGSIPGLVPKQLRFCRNYIEIMPSVAEGVKLGIQECQHQFRGRRWNCTTIDDSLAIFGPVLDKATRESAFVHAIASAGVAFAVTRSCAEGTSTICGCDSHHKGPPGEGWKWGGCSEDADFGVLVSREFADARENRPDARSAMNKHNNEAGRTTILDHMHLKCKCHGLSGSCEVKTCWWAQPDFRAIGDFLKDKYDSASEMVVEKHRESRGWVETLRAKYALFKPPTERDLVYYENSPNFCEPNPETGSFGTRDRTCNVTSHGIDGCDLLCCGRGHNTRTEKRKEKCHCIFHWCCYVSCQECIRIYDVHTCK
uniref:Protein Wnt n=1 Tax=Bos taurus TaxID=9913 RepID=A0AAA9TZ28_BOVIN